VSDTLVPLERPVVFQVVRYGARVAVAIGVPLAENATEVRVPSSVALAVRVTVPRTSALLAGAVQLTLGGALSTITATPVDVVTLPAPSVARDARVWDRLATLAEFHD